MPVMPAQLERVPWSELGPEFIAAWGWPNGKWDPQHLAVLGPSGSGKSRFYTQVLDERTSRTGAHAVILATKPADETLTRMAKHGWKIRRDWPPNYGESKVIFWVPSGKPSDGYDAQRRKIKMFGDDIWKPESNLILAFDEIAYVEQELGLQRMTAKMLREGRSLGLTIVATTQRPRGINRLLASETSYAVCFRPDDEDDASRVAEIVGGRRTYRDQLMELDRYEFLIINRRDRLAYISKMDG